MNERHLVKKSKKLSWLLRHGATEAGLRMDAAGWANVADVCRLLRMTEGELEDVIRRNNKGRLRREGNKVRCCQGHSSSGMPVTQEALEASWEPFDGEGPILHGTSVSAASSILTMGILPMRRTHVHLADSAESKVGKRANVALLLAIDPRRLEGVWVSPNGVILTREVPPDAIVGIQGCTKKGKAAIGPLRERLRASQEEHGLL